MVFDIRDDRIIEVREYVDSLYAQRKLFDRVGLWPRPSMGSAIESRREEAQDP